MLLQTVKPGSDKGDSTCKLNGGEVRALGWKDRAPCISIQEANGVFTPSNIRH